MYCFAWNRYVIAELIETEKDYVKDLGLMVEVRYRLVLWLSCLLLMSIVEIFVHAKKLANVLAKTHREK